MKIYISGPMTGIPNHNYPAFYDAEMRIHKAGKTPLNPACLPVGLSYRDYMKLAMVMVEISDALVVLPDWQSSPGAKAEVNFALSLGMNIIALADLPAPPVKKYKARETAFSPIVRNDATEPFDNDEYSGYSDNKEFSDYNED